MVDGNVCVGCTIILGLLLGDSKPVPPPALRGLCSRSLISGIGDVTGVCEALAQHHVASAVVEHAAAGLGPDQICRLISLCTGPQRTCTLYQQGDIASILQGNVHSAQAMASAASAGLAVAAAVPPQRTLLPWFDRDRDRFSTYPGLRGSHWRGKDCDAKNADVHPGRRTGDGSASCNGINATMQERLCGGSDRRGVALLGDSAGAHFSVPFHHTANWTIDDWARLGEDELDYPQCSWSTGHLLPNATGANASSASGCPYSPLPLDSIYLRLRARNRCNHRDYQNIGVNGARSTSMMRANTSNDSSIITSLARDADDDFPLLVFYALVGNDVCNPHTNQTAPMTSPQEFEERVTDAMRYLNATLPVGSHLVFVGLLDGQMMWNTMHDRVHPGLSPIRYGRLWDYLSCLESNPCWGWLNSNATWRNYTSARAAALNDVYRRIVAASPPPSPSSPLASVTYLDYPVTQQTANEWAARGLDPALLFEAVGGGHPSQSSNAIVAKALWQALEATNPAALGAPNPHNDEIERLFGDQGGY